MLQMKIITLIWCRVSVILDRGLIFWNLFLHGLGFHLVHHSSELGNCCLYCGSKQQRAARRLPAGRKKKTATVSLSSRGSSC
uniref:Secreted protein n=1 Tax=Arundo donax TaxID=35708 RepID=A0A0A9CMR2_ARUDO